jgi:arsenate reductase|tara:strand:- start:162 stop:536 length:375 start_codon:yes stop_codon:yes gene_type:complete
MKQVLYHIFHNPRCSKSREALKLLSVKTDDYKIIKYLEVEINKRDLTKIIEQLKISSNNILRKNEKTYKNLKLSNTNLTINEIVNLILTYPILLQRPIIAKYQNNNLVKTLIGRPPEKILSIFD